MRQNLYLTAILVLIILFVVNLLSNEFYLRFDFTDEQQYTLSQATKDILNDLEKPITVKAYFSKDLPSSVAKTRQDFQEMLIEYASLSDGMLLYEFIDPSENEEREQEVISQGIQPVLINVREKDQVKQQKAFLGAVVATVDQSDVIPFMQPGTAMEYTLSTAIKKISIDERASIGFVSGHGEPALSELGRVNTQLSILYDTKEINIDSANIPPAIKTLVIIRPTDSIPLSSLAKVDDFLNRGGRVAIAMNRVVGNLQTSQGAARNTGLEVWLQEKGILVDDKFVADASCGAVTVRQQQGLFTMQSNVAFPYIPVIKKFAEHPITKGLEAVLLEFASPISYTGDSSRQFTPLAFTSDKSNVFSTPLFFDIQKQWNDDSFTLKNLVVAAAVERNLPDGKSAKMVVISDGNFVVSGPAQNERNLEKDNVNFISNSIDWLSDDTGLIELRTKGVTSRPIDEVDDSTKIILKYANFLSPIILVALYGLVRMQRNRMKRLKRAGDNYEEV